MGAASSSSSSSTSRSSSLTVGEKLCAALIPCVVAVEVLIHCLSSCFDAHDKRPVKPVHTFDEVQRLARNSPFSVNEVEALRELFNKLSCSIIDDGLIHKEELQLALLNSAGGENLFLNKVFDLFDEKQNGVIEFEEFVHVLSIFHPNASIELKIDYAFKLYDLRKTGYIEREEVQEMIVAALKETGMHLSDEVLEQIIDNVALLKELINHSFIDRSNRYSFLLVFLCFRHLLMRMLTWTEELIKKSGGTLLFTDPNS